MHNNKKCAAGQFNIVLRCQIFFSESHSPTLLFSFTLKTTNTSTLMKCIVFPNLMKHVSSIIIS